MTGTSLMVPEVIDRFWLKEALKKSRKTQKGLADALGIHESGVSQMLSGKRKIQLEEQPVIIKYVSDGIHIDVTPVSKSGWPKVLGRVSAGTWVEKMYEDDQDEAPLSKAPPVPDIPPNAQFDLIVEGTSINRFAQDGQMIRCVEYTEAGLRPQHGDLVVVERVKEQGGLRETTVKQLRIFVGPDGKMTQELWPYSTDPAHQDKIAVTGDARTEGVHIIAKVWATWTPAPNT